MPSSWVGTLTLPLLKMVKRSTLRIWMWGLLLTGLFIEFVTHIFILMTGNLSMLTLHAWINIIAGIFIVIAFIMKMMMK